MRVVRFARWRCSVQAEYAVLCVLSVHIFYIPQFHALRIEWKRSDSAILSTETFSSERSQVPVNSASYLKALVEVTQGEHVSVEKSVGNLTTCVQHCKKINL